jgi:DNA-binding transcriptional LysR family regulator
MCPSRRSRSRSSRWRRRWGPGCSTGPAGRCARPDAGEVLLQHARRALRELDAGTRAIHDVADLSRGSLRLALTPTFFPYLVGPLV